MSPKATGDAPRPFLRARDLVPVDAQTKMPDAAGVLLAISRIGYSVAESIADLVDNSVDAGATHVLVRFIRRRSAIVSVAIVDNGRGMDEAKLDDAMQFGARIKHGRGDLGKYGMGLKAASFSHCRTLTVVSRSTRRTAAGRRWTTESIRRGWVLESLSRGEAASLLDHEWDALDTSRHGTLVLWEDLTRLRGAHGSVDDLIDMEIRKLGVHLGLHFHRFVAGDRLAITIDVLNEEDSTIGPPQSVSALDPFGYPATGKLGYPKNFVADIRDVGKLELRAHIWPARSKAPEYTLGGGRVSQRQGFYFYRNDRLIQAGGWNLWQQSDAEPHLSLARVEIDLPIEFDEAFGLNVQKSAIGVPPTFAEAMDQARSGSRVLRDYLRDADGAYRSGAAARDAAPLVLADGVPARLSYRLQRLLTDRKRGLKQVGVRWADLPPDSFFQVDRDSSRINLNRRYRASVLNGQRGSKGDAALIKVVLFFLLSADLESLRVSRKDRERLELWNSAFVEAVKQQEAAAR